jgi:hypothetical protein
VEDLPDGSLKARKLGGELGILFGCFGEVQQLLADQIIQRVFKAESPSDTTRGLALLSPNQMALHENEYPRSSSTCQGIDVSQIRNIIASRPSSNGTRILPTLPRGMSASMVIDLAPSVAPFFSS